MACETFLININDCVLLLFAVLSCTNVYWKSRLLIRVCFYFVLQVSSGTPSSNRSRSASFHAKWRCTCMHGRWVVTSEQYSVFTCNIAPVPACLLSQRSRRESEFLDVRGCRWCFHEKNVLIILSGMRKVNVNVKKRPNN